MPTSTSRFRFEYRVLGWAEDFTRTITGARCAVFVAFRADGTVRRVYFAPPGGTFDGARKAALVEAHPGWLLYSPYDEEGTGYLEWLGVGQDVAERWIGRRFEPLDFVDVRTSGARDAFPDAWRVILA
ncbi:MAG: hypothetical protein ACI9K2_003165 [Myxococcota bacterium]|jgi:hypothetical protein